MHTEGGNEALAGVGDKTERARGATGAHVENVRAVDFAPGAIPKDCLFNQMEKRVLIGLVDLNGDGVGHCVQVNRSDSSNVKAQRLVILLFPEKFSRRSSYIGFR